jgi:N-carbamoyl-L-amino-acid hydrolase
LDPTALDRQFNGIEARPGLIRIGGDPTRLAEARRASRSLHCYLELHIEQGGTLAKASIPIGVVDGIVSIDQYAVEIRGFANHAGTTPMPERRNALLAAAKLIEAVQDEVTKMPGRQVGTVGQLTVFPNAPNVVPGLVKHTIEFRDLSEETLVRLGDAAKQRAQEIAAQTGTQITITQIEHLRPALATPQIQKQIEAAAAGLGLQTMHLPSGGTRCAEHRSDRSYGDDLRTEHRRHQSLAQRAVELAGLCGRRKRTASDGLADRQNLMSASSALAAASSDARPCRR